MPTILGLTNDSNTSSSPSSLTSNKPKDSKKKNNSNDGRMGGNGRLSTISKRNHAAAIEAETLLWRALCDSPDAAREYLAEDCIMINPLFADSAEESSKVSDLDPHAPLSKDSDPPLSKLLEGGEPWAGFRFHGEPAVAEVDLMAVALLYKVTLFRQGGGRKGKGLREVDATVSSTWRQTAGADWLLVAHHVAYAD